MQTIPAPPPRTYQHERPRPPPYRGERRPHPEPQEPHGRHPLGPYTAPRHDDPLTMMGLLLVTAALKMGRISLVEVGGAELQDQLQYRMAIAENKTRIDHKQNGKKSETAQESSASQQSTTSRTGWHAPSLKRGDAREWISRGDIRRSWQNGHTNPLRTKITP